MSTRNVIFLLLGIIVLAVAAASIPGHLDVPGVALEKGWKYKEGDDKAWAASSYDDRDWKAIVPSRDIHDSLSELENVARIWLRYTIDGNDVKANENYSLNIRQSVASEIYLNGKMIRRFGVLGNDTQSVRAYDPGWKPIPVFFSPGAKQVIAVRAAMQPGVLYTKTFNTLNPLLTVELVPTNEAISFFNYTENTALNYGFLLNGTLLMLLILHAALFFLYPAQRANLYFALYALVVIIGNISQGVHLYYNHKVDLKFFFGNFAFLGYNIGMLFLNYSLQIFLLRKNDIFFRLLIFLGVVATFLDAFIYEGGWLIGAVFFQIIVYVNIARLAIQAVRSRVKGSWIIAVGVMITSVFFATFIMLVRNHDESRTIFSTPAILITNLVNAMGIVVAISLFLALDFAYTNKSLQETIRKNNDLAEANRRQQQEKQEILVSMNQELEKKVEERTAELTHSLEHLRSAQAQLIQSEKMASLGELTAGVAHEIQNPLNFVNNFSDLNRELIAELQDELKKGEVKEAISISESLKENEEKINHHGKRADGIVKSMLQHSRSSSGQKELTDVNKLVDEYVRLAYHGYRAKQKDFNAAIDIDLDPNAGVVPMVAQDIGRVLLNVLNNAFYACMERSSAAVNRRDRHGVSTIDKAVGETISSDGNESARNEVAVSTKRTGDTIVITVKDNGSGIPRHIREKIFQPFFTTKPTGHGTGLGLSLSYDIIKTHGGRMYIDDNGGGGTIMNIELPVEKQQTSSSPILT
ncbi:ATP-binding protein [Pollutibacter soli]|uniref:ATP-binding protein n=1 Tax=Pollutibacter soli TaxID=3034157 RepID=UPI0030136F80